MEGFNPKEQDVKEVLGILDAAEDYVFNLKIDSLLSHIDPNCYFSRLANLNKLELTFGAPNIRKNYERSLFGMKVFDAEKLAGCIKTTDVLTSLVLPCNLLDDQLLTLLMGGLIQNQTVTHLDLSHNK